MKAIAPALKAYLAKGSSSLVRLWTITLVSGDVKYYADGTSVVFYDGNRYLPRPGIQISAIRDSTDTGYADATVTAVVSDEGLSEDLVRYRLLKDASFSIVAIDYEKPELGSIYLFGGTIGDYVLQGRVADFSVKGGTGAQSDVQLGELYSERCRNVFGDRRCKKDLKSLEVPFEVVGIDPTYPNRFYISITLPGQENTNGDLSDLNVETIGLANGNFIVPDCKSFSVTLRGGGAKLAYTIINGVPHFSRGFDGASIQFGPMVARGGLYAGGERLSPGTATGGDTNTTGGGREGVSDNPYPGGDFTYRTAGAGGLCSRVFLVGADGDYAAGDAIPYAAPFEGGNEYPIGTDAIAVIVTRTAVETIDNGFNYGSIKWASGANRGYVHSIMNVDDRQRVVISGNINQPVAVGDNGVFRPGCSNYRSNCLAYNNIANFRAEPDVPNLVAKPYTSHFIPDPVAAYTGAPVNFGKS